jgi:hypothetical protein
LGSATGNPGSKRPISVLVSVIAGPEAWDPETGHVRLSSRWWRWFMGWVSNYSPDETTVIVDIEREVQVAHARSLAVYRAQRQRPAPDFLFQLDTDVMVENSITETARLCNEDRDKGFAAVTSPGMSSEGILEVSFNVDTTDWSYTEPFEIEKSWMGFFSLSHTGYSRIPPLGYSQSISAEKMEMYCATFPYMPCPYCGEEIEGMGEDVAFCKQIRKVGMRIAADPRIRTTHLKVAGLRSLRPGMNVLGKKPAEKLEEFVAGPPTVGA